MTKRAKTSEAGGAGETIADLRGQLREAERRHAELKTERDQARDLIERMREQIDDANAVIESWIEAFEMVLDDNGVWKWSPSFIEGDQWVEKYRALLRQWNAFVPRYNARVNPKDIGRPLAATKEQEKEILKLHGRSMSLRAIAAEIGIGVQTVRTVVGRQSFTDRSSMKRLERLDPDRPSVIAWKARKRARDALPRRINAALEQGRALSKEAKGLR